MARSKHITTVELAKSFTETAVASSITPENLVWEEGVAHLYQIPYKNQPSDFYVLTLPEGVSPLSLLDELSLHPELFPVTVVEQVRSEMSRKISSVLPRNAAGSPAGRKKEKSSLVFGKIISLGEVHDLPNKDKKHYLLQRIK